MSNPGVIKLAKGQVGKHSVWLDDNIGESIHLHIDDWRIDFTITDFINLCDELELILSRMIDIDGLRTENWDARFFHCLSFYFKYILEVRQETVFLKDLSTVDDCGMMVDLDESSRVKALKGLIDLNDTEVRSSNYINETNETRLRSCMEYVKKNGYPVDNRHIIITGRRNLIIDGWHRASCLYRIHGNIAIPIKRIVFADGAFELYPYSFPANRIKKGSRIILYGAGGVGRAYYKKITDYQYCQIVAWVDRDYERIGSIENHVIVDPHIIKSIPYDYVLIANVKETIKEEICKYLVEEGVDINSIVY